MPLPVLSLLFGGANPSAAEAVEGPEALLLGRLIVWMVEAEQATAHFSMMTREAFFTVLVRTP